MAQPKTGLFGLAKATVRDFLKDDCIAAAAALSYYTIFSLPALLILILLLLGSVMDPRDVQGELEAQIQGLMGASAADQVRTILAQAKRPGGGLLPTVLGIAALLFGATGAFAQLQRTLNRTWNVAPDPARGGFKAFLLKRLFSFGMILVIGFLLLVSLAISAVLSALGDRLTAFLPSGVSEPLLQAINLAISLAVATLLFAAMFKTLPDARIGWRSVWIGAAVTALLFVLGKFLIGFYLGQSNPGEAYGAAGSLIIMLLWVYYTAIILLFGAEFTENWAELRGQGIEPEPGAVRVRQVRHQVGELGRAG
ncbi:MAG: YihY/virulence factor BrkB family protein [Gemmatimonadales bacterium]